MSAYMVSRGHIAYLLDAAMSQEITRGELNWVLRGLDGKLFIRSLRCGDFDRAALVGQMLWNENRKSIEHRYPDTVDDFGNAPGPNDESFIYDRHVSPDSGMIVLSTMRAAPPTIDPVQVIKSCFCFDYQSCEHPRWRDSEAKAFIDSLIHHAAGRVPGYDAAEWGPPAAYKLISA